MKEQASFSLQNPESGPMILMVQGCWKTDCSVPEIAEIDQTLPESIERLELHTDEITTWDSLFIIFIRDLITLCRERSIELDLSRIPDGARTLLDLAERVPEQDTGQDKMPRSWLYRLGTSAIRAGNDTRDFFHFGVEIFRAVLLVLQGKSSFRGRDFFYYVQACGADALPIVSLISILVGVVLAFVGAVQLQMFGAQIYVANLVALSMVLEMGALMVGIIVAGRTGAAYAAQLGTMQVNEEIDALRTMGISPICFLVLPRMLALILMLPLLCIYADLLGIIGGTIIGVFMLDLGLTEYLLQTQKFIELDQVAQGLIKSSVYGVLIGYAGCLRGMQCGRSASAVGEAATAAVVTSIVFIVVSDAIITILFNVF